MDRIETWWISSPFEYLQKDLVIFLIASALNNRSTLSVFHNTHPIGPLLHQISRNHSKINLQVRYP